VDVIGVMEAARVRAARLEVGETAGRGPCCLFGGLKGLAELTDMSFGDLFEGIALHAMEGKAPFSRRTLEEIASLKKIYALKLSAADSHSPRED
jgi:hypothetical protein